MDTTMELDDVKSAWQALDRRLELDNRLKLHALHERSTHQTRRALRPLFWGQIAQILFALPFIALAALLWMSHPVHLATIVAGVLVHAYGVLTIICAGVVLGQLGKVDYSQPVLDIQKHLLRARTLYIRSGMIAGLLFAYAIHHIGPQRATLMLALVPGLSAVAAVPLLGEPLDAVTLAGVVLVTVGAVLGATHQSAK